MKIKIKKKWSIIIIIVLLFVGFFVIKPLFKSPTEGYITEKIIKGEVLQEVSETGNIKATDDFSLGFKSIGKVSQLYVAIGDTVKRGQTLASLDSSQLSAQLQAAKAAANNYGSGLVTAQDNLQSAYSSALNVLTDSYAKIYNAYFKAVVEVKDLTTWPYNDRIWENKYEISRNYEKTKQIVDQVNINKTQDSIDDTVSQTLLILKEIKNSLTIIREKYDEGMFTSIVSSDYKSSLDVQIGHINSAISNVSASQQAISSYKIALQKIQDSQIDQAQGNVGVLQSQIDDSYLVAPTDGIITQVDIKRGETVSAGQSAITLLSNNPFQIKAYIYEQDIVNVKIGDKVRIDLVAFPKQTFEGKVLLIDPAETIIDNVIYYKVTIDFPNQPSGIKSGMTADIVIETSKKEKVLRVPKNAVERTNGKGTVQVVEKGKIIDKEITVGLEGNDYYEVLSGLEEGATIITGKK